MRENLENMTPSGSLVKDQNRGLSDHDKRQAYWLMTFVPVTAVVSPSLHLLLRFSSSLPHPPHLLLSTALRTLAQGWSFLTLSSSFLLYMLCLYCCRHSSCCCHLLWAAVQTERKAHQRLPLLTEATKIKDWIYPQSPSHTWMHRDWNRKDTIKKLYIRWGAKKRNLICDGKNLLNLNFYMNSKVIDWTGGSGVSGF